MEKSSDKRLKWWQHLLQLILIFVGVLAGVSIYLYIASLYIVDEDLVVQQEPTKSVREEQRVVEEKRQEVTEEKRQEVAVNKQEAEKPALSLSAPKEPLPVIRPEDIYEVIVFEEGLRLTLLAKEYFKNKVFWVYIYDFNRDNLNDPNNIPMGMPLKIPVPEYYHIDADDPQSVNRAASLQRKIQEQYS